MLAYPVRDTRDRHATTQQRKWCLPHLPVGLHDWTEGLPKLPNLCVAPLPETGWTGPSKLPRSQRQIQTPIETRGKKLEWHLPKKAICCGTHMVSIGLQMTCMLQLIGGQNTKSQIGEILNLYFMTSQHAPMGSSPFLAGFQTKKPSPPPIPDILAPNMFLCGRSTKHGTTCETKQGVSSSKATFQR